MIYANLNVSSGDHPEWKQVELIRQIDEAPFFRFVVRDLETNHTSVAFAQQLRLVWRTPGKGDK